MANLSLEKYFESIGIELIRTNVGDRYVYEEMTKTGSNFGGEPSGHLIINDFSTTGDAIISSLQVLSLLIEKNKPISELTNLFTLTKQINHEVKIGKKNISNKTLEDLSLKMREKIGNEGRLIIRKSGTEPLIRIMVETDNHELGNKLINEIKSSLDFLS